ncbi:uncharacterized protein V6R79_016700 [Siganus canaliculatus]
MFEKKFEELPEECKTSPENKATPDTWKQTQDTTKIRCRTLNLDKSTLSHPRV